MKNTLTFFAPIAALLLVAGAACAHGVGTQIPAPRHIAVFGPLPALPSGVADLRFSEMFKMPIGPMGLEPSPTLEALNGHQVRLVGYMANNALPVPGRLILAPLPVSLGGEDEALADDLPASAVFVHLSGSDADVLLPNFQGLIQLQGRLEVGAADEPSGHVSSVRLILDDSGTTRLAEAARVAQMRLNMARALSR